MSKAYSNKALPPGTVLREWRLEEVLGVGGFGIVYKARGIYFNELVAIKEYFPSSISERDEEATVVPIDSDAEEVHALGLKKFVEEAKLLWNLSTPSRHPNIVSVRSLFEIHGTAYMVMDFEDGTSLSRLLKNGQRFNERSLWDIIAPISEGLDRAHRVGVLHRDIKPPNILITPEGRSVLIDFGSARFDTAEATSTQVTFHTPPYAAIEQYVKTYSQGPWTDIYALGVVLFECVTGAKPPEVLERLHGGQIELLAAGKWPGYGKKFLAAIDAAMTIKPEERPQSITAWLALFPKASSQTADDTDDIVLPPLANDADRDIMGLAQRFDAAALPHKQSLLVYLTFRFPHDSSLQRGWELGRAFALRNLALKRGLATVLVQHAPHRMGSPNPPHLHLMILPRKLTGLGFGVFDDSITNDAGLERLHSEWVRFLRHWG